MTLRPMCRKDFYPRPPRGGRHILPVFPQQTTGFLSTPSARRATAFLFCHHIQLLDFYPRPPRGGRLCQVAQLFRVCTISIHALREEGDHGRSKLPDSNDNFYPRPPRGGRRTMILSSTTPKAFLSTPSARRATAKTERKHPAFVSLYTSLHKLQRDACKTNCKITPLLAQTAGIPVRSVPENHVCCRFTLAGHQKISTLSWANSGCSPTCSTLVW